MHIRTLRDKNGKIPPKKKILITAIVVAIVTIVVLWIASSSSTQAVNHKAAPIDIPMFTHKSDKIFVAANSPIKSRLVIATVTVADDTASDQMSFPGVVEANAASTVNIQSPLTGRLVALNVKLGDIVKKGQILAIISSSDLAQALADSTKANDSLELANRTLARVRGINSVGANATKDIEAAESIQIQARAEYTRTKERLGTLGADVSKTNASNVSQKSKNTSATLTIVAPISGAITALNVGTGAYLNDSTASLMTISNLDNVLVSANIPENLSAKIRQGLAAEFTLPAYPNQIFHGTISSISSVLDADTRRSKARIAFTNENLQLKPNMFATVKITVAQTKQLSVPTSALLMNNDNTTVFVEVTPNVFMRRVVELGTENDSDVKIVSGLIAGDRVVIRGGVLLND